MSVDAMPADKVSVTDSAYKQLMADQVAGKLIRKGSGNAPESVDQGLSIASRFGDVNFGKVTTTSIDLNGSGDVSGSWTVHGTLNAQGGLTVTNITATGTATVVGLNAGNISASGTLSVNGATTLTGKLTANGGLSTKGITASSLDINGNGDISGSFSIHGKTTVEDIQANGNVNVDGLLQVTGKTSLNGGASVSSPENFVNTNDVVPASWVWNLIQRFGLGASTNQGLDASELFPSRDLNDVNVTGFYTVGGLWSSSHHGTTPHVVTGILLHIQRRYNSEPIALQLIVDKSEFGIIFYRLKKSTGWDDWIPIAKNTDVLHINEDEVVNGYKFFAKNLKLLKTAPIIESVQNIDTNSTIPSESKFNSYSIYSNDGERIAYLQLASRNDGSREWNLMVGSPYVFGRMRGISFGFDNNDNFYAKLTASPVTDSNDNSIATTGWSVGKQGNRGNLAGYETPVVQSTALTVNGSSHDSNLVTGAVRITVSNGVANQSWTKTVAISNASATISLGTSWKWYGGAAPDVRANCVLVLHWCSTFGLASLLVTD